MREFNRIAVFGGVYSKLPGLENGHPRRPWRGVDAMVCLGDLGAFGRIPTESFRFMHEHNILCVQGNYDDSIATAWRTAGAATPTRATTISPASATITPCATRARPTVPG